jgi:hypothetical protein
MASIRVFDVATNHQLGTLTEPQLQFLIDHLEEESTEDRDYYINRATLESFESAGADPGLLELFRKALGDREEMDIRWEKL